MLLGQIIIHPIQNGIQCGDGTHQALVYNNYINQAAGYGIFDSGGGGIPTTTM
jgi:hypothetical protein